MAETALICAQQEEWFSTITLGRWAHAPLGADPNIPFFVGLRWI